MTADLLHPVVQHHIVNSLGWPALRPLQEHAVLPVLRGDDALLLAPTAGGKTEAAAFPLLSRMAQDDWRGLSVLYICPLRALLNNLNRGCLAMRPGSAVGSGCGTATPPPASANAWPLTCRTSC